MKDASVLSLGKMACCAGLIVVALRFLTLGIPALVEPSDARYAQIAANMIEMGDWIMPRIQESGNEVIPYWSKPPLAFWLMAGSLNIFGHSVWAVRLPSALAWLLTGVLILLFGNRHLEKKVGAVGALCYMTTFSVFVLSGTSLIDPLLTLLTAASMICFAEVLWGQSRRGYFLAGSSVLGLGVLTKGPIALAFPLISITAFLIWSRKFSALRQLPWISAVVIFAMVTVPWFFVAEFRTPGFLSYFLLEENLKRFFSSNISLTSGSGHRSPYGIVILLLPLMLLPWVLLVFPCIRAISAECRKADAMKFLVCWFLMPVVCLMFGRHVLATYLMPVIPPFALLLSCGLTTSGMFSNLRSILLFNYLCFGLLVALLLLITFGYPTWLGASPSYWSIALVTMLSLAALGIAVFWRKTAYTTHFISFISASLLLCGTIVSSYVPLGMLKSTSFLIQHLELQHHPSDTKITFLNRVPMSALFYRKLLEVSHLAPIVVSEGDLNGVDCGIVVVRDKDVFSLPAEIRYRRWESVGRWRILDLGRPHDEHLARDAI